MNTGLDNYKYQEINCKTSVSESEYKYVDVYLYFELNPNEMELFQNTMKKTTNIPEEILKNITISNLNKNCWKSNEDLNGNNIFIDLAIKINLLDYYISGKKIGKIKANNQTKITLDNVNTFLETNQKSLTIDLLKDLLAKELDVFCKDLFPNIIYWKAAPEFLINESISLSLFKDDTSISNPLKYIFNIHGEKTDEEIKIKIESALENHESKSELEDELTESITKHVNKIWKEHKINFKIKFDGDKCNVHIEDKTKAHKYYNMNQRSDGFKQFVSFILTISAQNTSSVLKDNIIILDEPEIHLHPSGIRYMRDELLKIGKNNYVFVATHSHFMIDTEAIDRHWIVEKNNGITIINQLLPTSNISDEVLYKAFGLSFMKELLPEYILLVEGYGDKIVFNHILSTLDKYLKYTIKSAGGCSKINNIIALLLDEEINSFVLLDGDDEGQKTKTELLKAHKSLKGKVFMLNDILNTLPNKSTLEDLLPKDFVKVFFDKECDKDFILVGNEAVLSQLKNQDDTLKNKDKLEKLKSKLSDLFVESYNTKEALEVNAPLFSKFIINLIQTMK